MKCDRCGRNEYMHLYVDSKTRKTFCNNCETGEDWADRPGNKTRFIMEQESDCTCPTCMKFKGE